MMTISATAAVPRQNRLDDSPTVRLTPRHPSEPVPSAGQSAEDWARGLIGMPSWVVATALDLTLQQADRVRAVVADLLAQAEVER